MNQTIVRSLAIATLLAAAAPPSRAGAVMSVVAPYPYCAWCVWDGSGTVGATPMGSIEFGNGGLWFWGSSVATTLNDVELQSTPPRVASSVMIEGDASGVFDAAEVAASWDFTIRNSNGAGPQGGNISWEFAFAFIHEDYTYSYAKFGNYLDYQSVGPEGLHISGSGSIPIASSLPIIWYQAYAQGQMEPAVMSGPNGPDILTIDVPASTGIKIYGDASVPEPAAFLLAGSGLLVAVFRGGRRKTSVPAAGPSV